MNQQDDIPEDLKDLAYTNDPRFRRLLVRELQRRRGWTIGQIVDLIFEDCHTEADFEARAAEWREAIDPGWSVEELKEWAMKRRR